MPKPLRLIVPMVLIAATLAATGGCSTMTQTLAQHQCLREADNRPDATQRKAECQQRLPTPTPSQRGDS